jgi:hypothetical protein
MIIIIKGGVIRVIHCCNLTLHGAHYSHETGYRSDAMNEHPVADLDQLIFKIYKSSYRSTFVDNIIII